MSKAIAALVLCATLAFPTPANADEHGRLYQATAVVGIQRPGEERLSYIVLRGVTLYGTEEECARATAPEATRLETRLRQTMPEAIVVVVWRCVVSHDAFEA